MRIPRVSVRPPDVAEDLWGNRADPIRKRLEGALEREREALETYSGKSRWQIAVLWAPAAIGVVVALALVLSDVAGPDKSELGRLASLCASLLIASLAGIGVVAVFGVTAKSPDSNTSTGQGLDEEAEKEARRLEEEGENDSRELRRLKRNLAELRKDLARATEDRDNYENRRRKQAGFGVMVSLILTCAAIVAGGLAILGWLTTFLCFAGLVTAVVQIFGVPLSLVAARSTGQPFILDGVKDQ